MSQDTGAAVGLGWERNEGSKQFLPAGGTGTHHGPLRGNDAEVAALVVDGGGGSLRRRVSVLVGAGRAAFSSHRRHRSESVTTVRAPSQRVAGAGCWSS